MHRVRQKLQRFVFDHCYNVDTKQVCRRYPYAVLGYPVGRLIVQRTYFEPFYAIANRRGFLLTAWYGMPLKEAITCARSLQSGSFDYSGTPNDMTSRHKNRAERVMCKYRRWKR